MKSLFRLPNLLMLAIAFFALASCNEDDGGFAIPPSLDLLSEAGFLSADATIGANDLIRVKLSATKGDNPMKSVEFQQDATRISDISRITLDGAAATSAAPLLLDALTDAFTWEVEITPHADGAADYTFLVTDDAGETSSKTITITIEKNPPTLEAPNGVLTLAAEAGQRTSIALTAGLGGGNLATLSVCENGVVATGADRFWFKGIMATDEFDGSLDLEEADKAGFTSEDLFIRANATAGTTDSYTVKVTDENGNTASLEITVEATMPATALEGDFKGVLLNQAGPDGQGGLDLDTGDGDINSTDPNAEIKDEGIDLSMPDDQNWKQQISGANGSTLAYLDPADFPENFNFATVTSKEMVKAAYDAATVVTISNKVATDDIFVVYNSTLDRYYLLQVSDIMLTATDNKDQYTFDIKW